MRTLLIPMLTLSFAVRLCAPLALLLVAVPAARVLASEPQWQPEQSEDGIALYSRHGGEHSYDVVKAVVTLDARPETLLGLLRNIERYPSWYQSCKQTAVLQRPSRLTPIELTPEGRFVPHAFDESYVLFFLQDLPSIEDRWAIVKNHVRIEPDGSLVISFGSLDSYAHPSPQDAVRMRLRGRWVLSPLSRERTRVTLELDIDPRTAAPAFLVDPKIHKTAFETLRSLRKLAAQPHSIALGRAVLSRAP